LEQRSFVEAQQRIAPFVRHTPLLRSAHLSEHVQADVRLKPECWQPTGSFKVRGALNKIGLLSPEERKRGIVTGSAGNHGLGVAYAAQCWSRFWGDDALAARIYVPTTAPRAKVDKLRTFDVEVCLEGETYEDAHQAAEAFAARTGAVYVEAYNDVDVIAGQGTMALEILNDLSALDTILVPVGGGGMVAGVAAAAKAGQPDVQVVGVQPEASPAGLLSLRDGVAYDPYDHEPTLADGLAGGFGAVPLCVAGKLIDRVVLASEADMRQAILYLLDREKLVVEASGAISIAPLLNGSMDVSGRIVVCILSGANVETSLLRDILAEFKEWS
jgi:threonine dehydratase